MLFALSFPAPSIALEESRAANTGHGRRRSVLHSVSRLVPFHRDILFRIGRRLKAVGRRSRRVLSLFSRNPELFFESIVIGSSAVYIDVKLGSFPGALIDLVSVDRKIKRMVSATKTHDFLCRIPRIQLSVVLLRQTWWMMSRACRCRRWRSAGRLRSGHNSGIHLGITSSSC